MSTLMSTIWLDPCLKTLCIPTALILSTSSNINTRHKAACCAGFRILLWANLSWCSKAEGPLTPASRFAVSQQPVAMVTSAQWQADAAAASRMIRPPSLNTRNCVVVTISHNPPPTKCHLALMTRMVKMTDVAAFCQHTHARVWICNFTRRSNA